MVQIKHNRKKRFRFALVGHTEELADAVQKAMDPETEEITIKVVRMGEALHTAQALFESGIEVILGHMGSSRLMRNATGKTVVNIPLSSIDLIGAFEKARKIDTAIGLTCYAQPRDDIPKIQELLDISIDPIIFKTFEEMESGIHGAYDQGIGVFVGGGVSRRIVHTLGGQHFVPVPRRTIVQYALEEARALARVRRRQLESEERIRTIIQEMDEGIVGIDEYGRVDIINKRANQILALGKAGGAQEGYQKFIRKINLLDALIEGKPIVDRIVTVNKSKALVKALPIKVNDERRGAVALLRDVQNVESMTPNERKK